MMGNVKLLICVVMNALFVVNVDSSMHWAVTENGRIEAQIDSVFHLRRPYDLIAFMEQEARLHTLDEIYQDLLSRKSAIDRKWVGLDSSNGEIGLDKGGGLRGFKAGDLEARLYAEDPDCVGAGGKPLTLAELFPGAAGIASLMKEDMRFENNIKPMAASDEGARGLPDCEGSYPLDLSMQAFEHLLGWKERHNLSMEPEPALEPAFLYHLRENPLYMEEIMKMQGDDEGEEWNSDEQEDFLSGVKISPSKKVGQFGWRVGLALAKNGTSWPLHNIASLYWRIMGNAPRAIECARRAVHLSPSEHRDVGLTQMGWVLLASGHPAEAAIILHAALDHSSFSQQKSHSLELIPLQTAPSGTHVALANAYALLSDYNRSMACYENALKLQPGLRIAELGRHSILCQQKLEKALLNMVDSLHDMLMELQEYHKKQEEWLKLQEKLLWEQAPLEVRLMNYGQDKLLTARAGQHKNCIHRQREGHMILSCDLEASHSLEIDITLSLQMLMKNVVTQAKKISSTMFQDIDKKSELMSLNLNDDESVEEIASEDNLASESPVNSKEGDEDDEMEFTLKPVDESKLVDHVTWEDVEKLMAFKNELEGKDDPSSVPVCPSAHQSVDSYICQPPGTKLPGAQALKWQENANNKD